MELYPGYRVLLNLFIVFLARRSGLGIERGDKVGEATALVAGYVVLLFSDLVVFCEGPLGFFFLEERGPHLICTRSVV